MKAKLTVQEEINKLGEMWLFLVGKEIQALPKVLNADENILALMSGFEGATSVLVCLTNVQVLFLDKNFWYGGHYRSIPLKRLTSTDGAARLFFADLTFYEGTRSNTVRYIGKKTFRKFVKVLDSVVSKNVNVQIFIKEIEKLGKLVEQGLLTKQEFEKKKQELLEEPENGVGG